MMPRCSDPNILAPWFRRRLPAALLLALLATPPAGAQSGLEALRRGSAALEAGRHDEAARLFERARQSLPQLADFAAFFQAQALMRAKRYDAAAKALEPALSLQAPSAVSGRAAVLGAQAWIELNQPKLALAVLGRVPRDLWPQPEGLLALAKAYEGAGDPLAAAAAWQDLWVRYPASEQAAEAASAMARLESALGGRYPPVMPGALLERAARLMDEGRFKPAREEFERLSGLLAGQERERALNGVAAALLRARETARALDWLRGLQLTFPETEAERQFHLVTCYLRLDRLEEMIAAATSIERIAPRSEWRRRALVAAANRLLVENDSARSMPLYQACADSFPESEDGPQCHWKIVWRQWLSRDPGAPAALQDHLKRFPASEKAGAALYFLARDAERRGEAPAARRYLQEIVHRFPNSYYAVLARQRLGRPELARNGASAPAAESFLAAIQWPVRQRRADFTPDQTTSYRIERGRLLAKAGLERWAEAEIRFGVRQDAKPYPSAMALAEIAASRRDYAQALRYIKATANGYLWLDPAGAPGAFWKQAFPLPFQDAIRRHAAAQKLDPYILAGLIRQESEFDPKAVSSSGAIGLTQIMPPTGRALARRAGVRGYRVSLLKSPETNLKIGAYYLRQQLNQRNGSIEETLAGYNGGPSRVTRWKTWGDFQEPAEFIETIPFTQTREYVQIILRNADVYRRLYSLDAASQPAPKPARKR
jgi:soluble lytic murein transglycosylase